MVLAGAVVCASILAVGCGAMWRRAQLRLGERRQRVAEVERRLAAAVAAARRASEDAAGLRQILDALPIPVWRRRGGALVDRNPAYAAALSVSREAALGQACDRAPAGGTEPGAPPGAAAPPFDIHVVLAGRRRRLEVNEVECGDEVVGVAFDRTDVESARGELRRHLAAHAAVLESLSAAVAIFGPDRRLKFFNTAFTGLWRLDAGWLGAEPTLDDILERLHERRCFPEYPDFRAFNRERCELFAALVEPRHELLHLPDGRTLRLTMSPHPFGGLTYVCDDVTDRLALECSYNTLAQVQRATLDHLFEGIAVFGGDGRLKLHNAAFRALWGLSEAEVAGEPHVGEIVDRLRGLLDDGGDWSRTRYEMVTRVTSPGLASGPLYRRDGSMLQVASVPLPDGEVLLTYLDVSDTARVERALRERNDALEAAGRLKTEFVANVSHELRTPLNTVIGFAEILHNQYFGPLNSSQREYSRGILESAHQLTALVTDMIDLASIEAGYLELEPGRVDVADLLRTVVSLARERARGRGLTVELRCPAQIGAIEGDARRLKQALFNLVSNAVKFTPPGGAVRVEAERFGDRLLLSVADSDAGIGGTDTGIATTDSTAMRAQIERRPSQAGCGFGLALVKSLVELHGGAVEIEAAPGRGNRVVCRLPVGRPGEAGARPEPGPSADEPERGHADSPCEAAA
jgi:signal transduction histidine kinase